MKLLRKTLGNRKVLTVILSALGFSTTLSGALLLTKEVPSSHDPAPGIGKTFVLATAIAGFVATLALVIDGLLGRRARS